MRTLISLNAGLAHASLLATRVILSLLTITVAYQVLSRYVSAVPRIMWTEELARAALIWLVFLGASFAYAADQHFKIDLLPQKLNARVRVAIDICASTLVLAVMALLLIGAYGYFVDGFGRTSTMSGVSLAYSYAALPITFAMMLLKAIENILTALNGKPPSETDQQEEVVTL